jgi:hypothetical protein
MVTKLNNAPPIRSNWKLGEEREFLKDCGARSRAAKADWLASREASNNTIGARIGRAFRRMIGDE